MVESIGRKILGWAATACFTLSALPQTLLVIEQGHTHGMASPFLWLWALGEVCMIIYTWPFQSAVLRTNYFAGLTMLSIILYYHIFGG